MKIVLLASYYFSEKLICASLEQKKLKKLFNVIRINIENFS